MAAARSRSRIKTSDIISDRLIVCTFEKDFSLGCRLFNPAFIVGQTQCSGLLLKNPGELLLKCFDVLRAIQQLPAKEIGVVLKSVVVFPHVINHLSLLKVCGFVFNFQKEIFDRFCEEFVGVIRRNDIS
jgi:hypothetical protein